METICTAGHKIVDMKNRNAKLVFECLVYPALLLMLVRFFVKRSGGLATADILEWIIAALVIAALLVRLIDWLLPRSFDDKGSGRLEESKPFWKK